MRTRFLVTVTLTAGMLTVGQVGAQAAPVASAAPAHAPIAGGGSTWVYNAIQNWSANARREGITTNYVPYGSGRGRQDFADSAVDFAVSDLTYTEAGDPVPTRPLTYFPIAAGAVGFVYHVKVAGQLKRNIRLSGPTLAGIYSGAVTNWNDARITADNHGHQVAADLPVTPVIRADGSATSYRLTAWFSQRFANRWRPFSDTGASQFFPSAGGRTIAATGSDGVVARVKQNYANGYIGYVETGYAVNAGFPLASVENPSGHFITPAADNVSLSLLRATTTPDGSANLRGVYNNLDPRAYPLSYYSYGIAPIGRDSTITSEKRQTTIDFFGYTSCRGQDPADDLGYAPLPLNLTRTALRNLTLIRRVDTSVDTRALSLSTCDNPTLSHNGDGSTSDRLAVTVPAPPPCSSRDTDPCPADATTPHRTR